ncbi:hypothetical protein P872_04055 [Rhodonellum psychrophilum GCM71 = DSM 17998]|uniref:Uncharacterized protein n=2 Tax=Rhodonellum TaxID=336827 RepID=U5BYE6_9BACT|nr:hypothetical protein P872_04055 [Rhodonellum psychrophilum GCM71 = DSM 17998]
MKYMKTPFLLLCLAIFGSSAVFGQEKQIQENTDPDSSGIVQDRLLPSSLPLLLFDDKAKEEKKKAGKKKIKKNIFFGERTTKGFTKQTIRNQTQYQFFHFTTQKRIVDPYIRDIFWFETKEKTIKNKDFDPTKGYLLHGPYEKIIDEHVVEKGMFYYGTKHGTWLVYDNKSILVDKGHYSEGWPKDSRVTYYTGDNKKIEKIIPVEYSLFEGNFFHFYENGQIAVTGEFRFGEKIGLWTEYWDTKNTKAIRKREIVYQERPLTKNYRPFIRAEWDKEGNLVYRNERQNE